MRIRELLRSKKREYFDDRLTRFVNSPKRFFNELNRRKEVIELKKSGNFIIADNENNLNTDDFSLSNLFNEKFVSISKTLAAPIPTDSFATEGLASYEESFSMQLIAWKSL